MPKSGSDATVTGRSPFGVGPAPQGAEPAAQSQAEPLVPNAYIPFSTREKMRLAIAFPDRLFPRIVTDGGLFEEYTHWQARAALETALRLAAESPAFAQAIEARRAETLQDGSVHESAVATAMRPDTATTHTDAPKEQEK